MIPVPLEAFPRFDPPSRAMAMNLSGQVGAVSVPLPVGVDA